MENVMEFKVDNPGTAMGAANGTVAGAATGTVTGAAASTAAGTAAPAAEGAGALPVPPSEDEVFAVDDPDMAAGSREDGEEPFRKQGVFEFNTPILIEGSPVSCVRYDFGRLRPVDLIAITQGVSKRESVPFPQLNLSVQANVFCRAASLPPSVVKTQMAADDFMAACSLARDFLLNGKGARKEDDLI